MATTLYLREWTNAVPLSRSTVYPQSQTYTWGTTGVGTQSNAWKLETSNGSYYSAVTHNTTNGPVTAPGYFAPTSGAATHFWMSDPISSDITVSSSVSFYLWCSESGMAANIAFRVVLYRLQPNGTVTTIADWVDPTEAPLTTAAERTGTVTPTSTNLVAGDRLIVTSYIDDAGTMATGYTGSVYFGNSTYPSRVILTENLSFSTATPTGTTLNFLNDDAAGISGAGNKLAWTDAASGAATLATTTLTGTTLHPFTDTEGGNAVTWWTPPLSAVTLSGLMKFNIRASATQNGVNRSNLPRVSVYKTNTDGSNPVLMVEGQAITDVTGTEATSTFLIPIRDSISANQRIKFVFVWGLMSAWNDGGYGYAAGYRSTTNTAYMYLEGTTQSTVIFPQTLTAAPPTAAGSISLSATATARATTHNVTASMSIDAVIDSRQTVPDLVLEAGSADNQGSSVAWSLNGNVTSSIDLIQYSNTNWHGGLGIGSAGATQGARTLTAGPHAYVWAAKPSGTGRGFYISAPFATQVTLSSSIDISCPAYESANTVNTTVGGAFWKASPDGTLTFMGSGNRGTELSTSYDPPVTWSVSITSTTFYPGDMLLYATYFTDATSSTMAAGTAYIMYTTHQITLHDEVDLHPQFTKNYTRYYFLPDASDISGTGKKKLSRTLSGNTATYVVKSVAAAAIQQWTDTYEGNFIEWYTPQLEATTFDGANCNVQFYGYTEDEAAPLVRIYKTDSDGSNPVLLAESRTPNQSWGYGMDMSWDYSSRNAVALAGSITQGQRLLVRFYYSVSANAPTGNLPVSLQFGHATYPTKIDLPYNVREYVSSGPTATGSLSLDGSATATGTFSGSASVTGSGSTDAKATVSAVASVTGAGSTSATATKIIYGTSSITGAGTTAATSSIIKLGASTVTGTGSTAALATQVAVSSVTGAGSTTAAAVQTIRGASSITGSGSTTAVGSITAISGTASVEGTGSTTAAAAVITYGSSTVTGAGSTTALATQIAVSSQTGAGSVTATGTKIVYGTSSATGAGTTSASAVQIIRSTSSVTGAGSSAALATSVVTGSTTGAGSTTATSLQTIRSTSSVDGSGSASALATSVVTAPSVTGVGSTSAVALKIVYGSSTVTGAGSTAALATQQAVSSVVGTGSTDSTAVQTIRSSSSASGAGTASALATSSVTASVTGAGSTSATALKIIYGASTVTGAGSTTALATQQAVSSISGVGSSSALATQIIYGTSTVAGTGSSTASATLTVYGTSSVTGAGSTSATGIQTLYGLATVDGLGSTTSAGYQIATFANDGTAATDVSGTWDDASEPNAYDDNATTYVSSISGLTTHVIDITGYNFGVYVGPDDELVSVSVNVSQYLSNITKFSSPTIQAYNGSTPIGTPINLTKRSTPGSEDNDLTVTLADIRSPNFKIRYSVEQVSV